MIDSDKLKPTLQAWQATETAIITATQAADAAFLRGDHAQAEKLSKQAQAAARDRHEKADHVARLVEGLIWQAEQATHPLSGASEKGPMKRDLLASVSATASPLELAARQVLRDALDRVELHPCDYGDDAVAARQLSPDMQALLTTLTGHNVG